jgi:hypothetical protein
MKKILFASFVPAVALAAATVLNSQPRRAAPPAPVAPIPNPGMTAPDMTAWNVFIQAVKPPAAAGPVTRPLPPTTFETWPSDADTFAIGAKPIGNAPRTADGIDQRPPVLPSAGSRGDLPSGPVPSGAHLALGAGGSGKSPGAQTPASAAQPALPNPTPPGLAAQGCDATYEPQYYEPACDANMVEEVRRNPSSYNYIVTNKLNSRSGLIKAYNSNFFVNFPTDSIEIKMNWLPVAELPSYYPGIPLSQFYIATDMVAGQTQQYALVAMHVISKLVPNWTWATFEHQGNRGRCDFIGCKDLFGATDNYVPPANAEDGSGQGTVYADCRKTTALLAAFRAARVAPVFNNYCLKGSQTDFTDNNGLAVRLGNSITESSFVPQASCMTCHGNANINSQGRATTVFGFVGGNGQVGPINPLMYNSLSGGRAYYQNQPGLTRTAISADFVWSIPFCAYDDVTDPKKPVVNQHCAGK